MKDFNIIQNKPQRQASLRVILLAGSLSMYFAEIWSGASTIWFLDLFGILVTFFLYLAHLIFYFNLAYYFKRIELKELYFWGMLFALYEAPITKVLWGGYIGQNPGFGTVYGIAFFEFLVLVFFWHPIFSFILPILALEIIITNINPNAVKNIPTSHLNLIKESKRNKLLILLLVFLISPFLSANNEFNLVVVGFAAIGTIIIILLLFYLVKRQKTQIGIENLILGARGFLIVVFYLIVLYIFSIFFILPERLPNNPISYITIITYALFVLLLLGWSGKYNHRQTQFFANKNVSQTIVLSIKWLYFAFALHTLLTIIYVFIAPIAQLFLIISYLSFVPLGITIFTYTVFKTLATRFFASKKGALTVGE